MEALLKSCGQESLAPGFDDLCLSVEDVSICEPSDLESDLGIDPHVAKWIVEGAKKQVLFETHRAAVRSTWKVVDDSLGVETTKLFYQHLFDAKPEAIAMFENADMDAQAEKLATMIGMVVKYLDNMESLIPVLQEMGQKHKRDYGCRPEHYAAVGDALVWMLQVGLKEKWTPEVAEAWAWVYGVIAKIMADAGEASMGEEKKQDDVVIAAAAPSSAKSSFSSSLSVEEKKKIVRETWSIVEPIAEHTTKIFYRDLRETDPKANVLFEKTDMESQEEKLAKMLGVAVKKLDDLESLVPILEEMAVWHVDFGVTKEMYDSFGASLLRTLEIGLGDNWTTPVKESWIWVYTIMRNVMVNKAYPD